VLLNENHRWVAVSNPALLTVNERQSETAMVHLDSSCCIDIVSPTQSMSPAGAFSRAVAGQRS
jgi:hypothetical protein